MGCCHNIAISPWSGTHAPPHWSIHLGLCSSLLFQLPADEKAKKNIGQDGCSNEAAHGSLTKGRLRCCGSSPFIGKHGLKPGIFWIAVDVVPARLADYKVR